MLVGIVYPLTAAASFDLGSMALPVQIGFVALIMASTVGATGLGIGIAAALRRSGVAAAARRRPAIRREPDLVAATSGVRDVDGVG